MTYYTHKMAIVDFVTSLRTIVWKDNQNSYVLCWVRQLCAMIPAQM